MSRTVCAPACRCASTAIARQGVASRSFPCGGVESGPAQDDSAHRGTMWLYRAELGGARPQCKPRSISIGAASVGGESKRATGNPTTVDGISVAVAGVCFTHWHVAQSDVFSPSECTAA